MKRNNVKKVVALFMAATMMFSVVGCGKKGNKIKEEKKDTKDMVYVGSDLPLEGLKGNINTYELKEDKLYITTYEWIESEGAGEEIEAISENEDIESVKLNDDTVQLLISSSEEDSSMNNYKICRIDLEGNAILQEEIKLNDDSEVNKMVMDSKGRTLLATSSQNTEYEIFVFDKDIQSEGSVKADFTMEGMVRTCDGNVICGMAGEEKAYVQVLDVENKEWGEKYELNLDSSLFSESLIDGMEYDFYYRDNSGIFGYDLEKKISTQIVDFVASNMTVDSTWAIVPIAEEKLLGTAFENEQVKLVLYDKVDAETVKDKQIITFGSIFIDENLKRAAMDFNKTNTQYQIEFQEYSDVEDPEAKMKADIIAGNIPDIIDLNNMPIEQYASKGILEDLMPYLEKDTELCVDDFIPSVFETMKTGDKLYYVSPHFDIFTMTTKESYVEGRNGWTFEEMKDFLSEKGDNARPFLRDNKIEMLNIFGNIFSDYIDWETGECYFDSDDFKSILELCNAGSDEATDFTESPGMGALLRSGGVLFLDGAVSMESVQEQQQMFGEDIAYIGYPNKDKEGSYFQFAEQLGISSKSNVKEGAWEFVRTLMTKEYQMVNYNSVSNPTRNDVFEMMVKAKMTTSTYTDELGQEILPIENSYFLMIWKYKVNH